MSTCSRRAFLAKVGSGVLVSALGVGAARELDLFGGLAFAEGEPLDFGKLESTVALIQETEADALLPKLKELLDKGTSLETLVAAGALANARTFGGEDYVGYHSFMALVPSLEMSTCLKPDQAALPVFKVLHRNAARMQKKGGRSREVLRKVEAAEGEAAGDVTGFHTAARAGEVDKAEQGLAALVRKGPQGAYEAMQPIVRDNIDVHQVVLTFRAYDMLRLTGKEHADVMLRQTLRQCIDRENGRRKRGRAAPSIIGLLPKLVEAHKLDREIARAKRLTDDELAAVAKVVFESERDAAAEHVAGLLGDGVSSADLGEAISLAAVTLLLHDRGASRGSAGKPKGCVHGASVGVHASDSAQAWRGIAAGTPAPIANASIVTGAWHAAGQSGWVDRTKVWHEDAREAVEDVAEKDLLPAIGEAVLGGDQANATALVERYGEAGGDPDALLEHLIGPAVENDGALHHEKYFHTATQEFARSRPAHRWRHLMALTRVCASGRGFEAPGVEAARKLLGT